MPSGKSPDVRIILFQSYLILGESNSQMGVSDTGNRCDCFLSAENFPSRFQISLITSTCKITISLHLTEVCILFKYILFVSYILRCLIIYLFIIYFLTTPHFYDLLILSLFIQRFPCILLIVPYARFFHFSYHLSRHNCFDYLNSAKILISLFAYLF